LADGNGELRTHSSDHVTCQEVVELVTAYLDGALAPDQTTLFEQHLNFCDGCITYVDQIRVTVATVGRASQEDVPAEARDRLMAAFRDWRRTST
jgi:anti-sigma factor (TIGR02949 family)